MRLARRLVVAGCLGTVLPLGLSVIMRRSAAAQRSNWVEQRIDGMRYDVLLPRDFTPDKRYPVLLYLHQLGMGSWPEGLHQEIDPWFEAEAFRLRHPAIVVVPMLDQKEDKGGVTVNFGGKRTGGAAQQTVISALAEVTARYRVDPARIYVTGNSMGGMGTWAMLLDYNAYTGTKGRIFAAGMPLAGRHGLADPVSAAKALKTVPIWAIHGSHDPEVPLDWDRRMATLMSGNPNFRYTEDPNLAHDVWDTYYRQQRVWDWLFDQKALTLARAS